MLSKRQDASQSWEPSDQDIQSLRSEMASLGGAADQPVVLDIVSHGLAQTQRLGARLGELLCGGDLVLLDGDLGTGKTSLTQGIAEGLGVREVVSSPTFTLLKEYEGRLPLYHFDLYRLDDASEILDLGFEEYFESHGVCVVEWANKAEHLWPSEHLRIRLKMISETKRGVLLSGQGARYVNMLFEFRKSAFGIGA
ncbi:MAG TPA: tRNA (adenosine(37)-N6)-threonylcarbamoyltransferase complex ATPase subunit type 1 TsaE [Ktedonobacterales bacterium]|jgi:tRNA threonylcarbamoyladenosine biosynthesis protein TsaE